LFSQKSNAKLNQRQNILGHICSKVSNKCSHVIAYFPTGLFKQDYR